MSVVIKSNEFNYKDPVTGNYVGLNAVAETTTAQQVQTIENKGQDVLDTIPSDYTDLQNMIVSAFDTTKLGTYKIGDYVRYNDDLYRCIADVHLDNTWVAGHWTQTQVCPEISDLKSALTAIENVTPTDLVVVSDYTTTPNKRLGYTNTNPKKPTYIDASGISVVEFSVSEGKQVYFRGMLFGLNGTYRSYFCNDADDIIEIHEDWSDIESPNGKTVTVPTGATKFIGGTNTSTLSSGVIMRTDYVETASKNSVDRLYHENIVEKTKNTVKFISRQGEFRIPNTLTNMPYNNLVGIQNASDNGYDAVRISVRLTSDNVPVLCHDASINSIARNSDNSQISTTVNVADHTLAELNQYDYGIQFGNQYAGMKITELEDALHLCKTLGMYCAIELYPNNFTAAHAAALFSAIVNTGMLKHCDIRTYESTALQSLFTSYPGLNYAMTCMAGQSEATQLDIITTALGLKSDTNTVSIVFGYAADGTTPIYDSVVNKCVQNGLETTLASVYTDEALIQWATSKINYIEVGYVRYPYDVFINSLN